MTEKEQPSVSSTEELDHILVEQLNSTRKSLKVLKRHQKLMPTDPKIKEGIVLIQNKINFFEEMIENKELIHKKRKKKKECDPDILSRGVIHTWYRNVFFLSTFGYRMLLRSTQDYLSLLSKKEEK
jgi:hypothetical protein